MPGNIERLFEHLVWADRRVLDALRDADAPPPRAMELYAHILAAEHIWASRLAGKVPAHPVWPKLNIAECAGLSARNEAVYRDLLRSLDAAGLARAVDYVNSAGQPFTSTVEDILLHVCLHGQYHRGQVALLLREDGAVPATTDFIAFARGAPAATRRD